MSMIKKYVGLDVSKNKIAVAIAEEGRESARYWGTIGHTEDAVKKLMKNLRASDDTTLDVCYEAGPTGYELYRWLLKLNIDCTVVAPSLIPRRAGDQIKTDKRDALRLAQLFRAGELISVHVPTPEEEALRDLVRAREDAKEDMNRHLQRLGKFLLRYQIVNPKGSKTNTVAHEEWLDTLRFSNECQRITFQEYRQAIWETKERMKRYDQEIERQATTGVHAPFIRVLQALRGVALITSATIASEMITTGRFAEASGFMSYCGLVSRESSSGNSRWQGGITKAGNAHLRRVLVEAAASYRHAPGIRRRMRERISGLPPEIQSIAWDAQNRLHRKYKELSRRGKHHNCIKTAVARELAGFVWAIAKEFERQQMRTLAS